MFPTRVLFRDGLSRATVKKFPLPVIPTCPNPSCPCPPTPQLDIDHEASLGGTVARYAQHLVIATGQADWTSRIENDGEDQPWGSLVRGLKVDLRKNPYNNVLVTNSSFHPARHLLDSPQSQSSSAFLFPSRTYISDIPSDNGTSIGTFTSAFLNATVLQNAQADLPGPPESLLRDASLQRSFPGLIDVSEELFILICGHRGRDTRCGVMGPLLSEVFQDMLRRKGFDVKRDKEMPSTDGSNYSTDNKPIARVGLISHIGGHKFAGNVIMYMPSQRPSRLPLGEDRNALLGKGVWYGRIEPKHVEGLIEETVLKGRIVEDLCRGVVGEEGELFHP